MKGDGKAYYFWRTEGISKDGSFKQEDSYIKVRKSFYGRDGRYLYHLNDVQQNDLIVVKITIQGTGSTNVENVAITDVLPAGFEIENERIRNTPDLDWIKNESRPDYKDIRDDRINLFTSVNRYEKHFYYAVRAVSPGTFQMGPVGADAMYNGEYHSYYGGGVVTIKGK